ncbi:hypothetical protein R5R35_006986 [Gryllus longicercus]|uniref:NADH:ubiquinone oxidoreductase intermediate-associated protein 30 domain-containing protein n=1 Tax=Gryllus longicercus TaxID=2509291 RepID=A0AAN9VBW9_9ORTH
MFSSNVYCSNLESGNSESLELSRARNETTLFDFTRLHSVDDWMEQSDTVREVGKSKAVLVLQKTKVFQRAVFFFLLNPQPNGAGFAGVRISTSLDLHHYENIALKVRRQGNVPGYKIILRHKGLNDEPHPTYEQFFMVALNEFQVVNLPLADFKPFYRGRPLNESEVGSLDTRNITSFGVQVYGGVYLPVKQSGPSTLEVDWIKATNTNQQFVTLI